MTYSSGFFCLKSNVMCANESFIHKHFCRPNNRFKVKDLEYFMQDIFCISIKDKTEAIYMIGDFYIGHTIDLKRRLFYHATTYLYGKHCNKGFENVFIANMDKGIKMPVIILGRDRKYEKAIISKLCFKYDLVNFDFNKNR